jgi:hypothetical protein
MSKTRFNTLENRVNTMSETMALFVKKTLWRRLLRLKKIIAGA